MLIVLFSLFPMACGLGLLLVKNRTAREMCAFVAACVTTGLVGWLFSNGGGDRLELFRLTEDFVCALRLDGAGKVYLGLAAVLWPLSVLFAVEYMRHEKREGRFFSWYIGAYGVVILLSAAENLFTLYIFYELLTLCTVPLVWHERNEESGKAALTYMLYLIGGAALGLLSVMLLPSALKDGVAFQLGGSALLRPEAADFCGWIVLMGFVGFGVKAAVLPLCRWLPKASVAPTPVTALLHAVAVVNAGVFAVLRLLYYVVPAEAVAGTWAQTAMLLLSGATVIYGAARAVREQHVKRRLAWSTVSNLSYMLLGLALLTPRGMAAGLSHMVFHGLTKIILFFCAGAALTQTGRTDLKQMQGLGRAMPLTFGCFALAGVSLAGVPPLAGFVSKYALAEAAFRQGSPAAIFGAVALLISAVLTCVYIFTVVYPAFFMKLNQAPGERVPRDPGPCMKAALLGLALLLILSSVFAGRIMSALTLLSEGGLA